MSSAPEDQPIYYLGKVGQRTQMTRAHDAPRPPPVLPPPSQLVGSRPQLPPLSSLPVPTASPSTPGHLPPPGLFEHSQPIFTASPSPGQFSMPAAPTPRPNFPQQGVSGPVSSFPHPALYPQRASFQSKNPGTVYEALSPVQYGSGGPISLFNEAAYSQNPYPSRPVSTFQSPPSSHQSSTTSSSVARSVEGSARPSHYQPSMLPTGPSLMNTMDDRYILTIRQQPSAARACGFGERDRRVIDPPPIVQLSLKDYDPTSKTDLNELQFPFNIMHCALLSASVQSSAPNQPTSAPLAYAVPPSTDITAVPDPIQSDRISRRLMGTLVASPFVAIDPEAPESNVQHARLGTFFIFPDLSCRQNGRYRLRFTLMKVPMGPEVTEGGQGSVCGSIDSEEFQVYSAKDFPGMTASSRLIRELKKQGAAVSVRKGKDKGLAKEGEKRGSSVSGSADEEDEVEESVRQAKKRG